jgi:hypothetical protein
LNGFTVQNIDVEVITDVPLISIRGCSPVIKNNIICDNLGEARNGGIAIRGRYDAVEILSRPTIKNNLIHHVKGPGVGNGPYSAATIQNNEIWDCMENSGVDHFGVGIGIRQDAAPTILDNHIFQNYLAGVGSRHMYDDSPQDNLWHLPGYDIIIKGNIIHHNGRAAICLFGNPDHACMDIQVFVGGPKAAEGNEIYVNQAGIFSQDIGGLTAENNNIYGNYIGIRIWNNCLEEVPTRGFAHIRNNQITDSWRPGIRAEGFDEIIIYGNDISHNGIVLGGMGAGIRVEHNQHVVPGPIIIQRNNVYGNKYAGIRQQDYVPNPRLMTIAENNVYQNGWGGIRINPLDLSTYVLDIVKNNVTANGRGGITTGVPSSRPNITLNIRQNKVCKNTDTTYGGGIDVRQPAGTIENNLVFGTHRGGIRFGDNITKIKNNTVVSNGKPNGTRGGGIIYTDQVGTEVTDPPTGNPPAPLLIRNNISAYNKKAGIRACFDNTGLERDYNLVYLNNAVADDCGWYTFGGVSYVDDLRCANMQFGGCGAHVPRPLEMDGPHDIIADPLFVNMDDDNYHLQDLSPGKDAGDDGSDMGCYGGAYPIHNLIDVTTSTGNNPAGGDYVMFGLGSVYTVTDVRLYRPVGSTATTWDVYVGDDSGGCTGGWGTNVGTVSLTSTGWNEIDVTDASAAFIKLVCTSHGSVPENSIAEFDYKKDEDSSVYWHMPSIVVPDCTDING